MLRSMTTILSTAKADSMFRALWRVAHATLIAALALASVSFAQVVSAPADAFQVHYVSNLNKGDASINLTNAGGSGGNICANVYAFAPDEQMISCCACQITPNGLNSYSVSADLISNPLTGVAPSSLVIKLVASAPTHGTCDASSPTAGSLVPGLRAWGTTIHTVFSGNQNVVVTPPAPDPRCTRIPQEPPMGCKCLTSPPLPSGSDLINTLLCNIPDLVTETEFSPAGLSSSELTRLTSQCSFIELDGSGHGICSACRTGGQ